MQNSALNKPTSETTTLLNPVVLQGTGLSKRMLQLELPSGGENVQWIPVALRMPAIDEVLLVKCNAGGSLGLVGGLHNGREIAVLMFLDLNPEGVSQLMPLIEDGMDRQSGLTHWRAWPTANVPSLVAALALRGSPGTEDTRPSSPEDEIFCQ